MCQTPETFEPAFGMTKQLSLEFSLAYSPKEFADTLDDIAEGRIDAAAALTSKIGLSEVPQAFAALRKPASLVKIMVEPAKFSG